MYNPMLPFGNNDMFNFEYDWMREDMTHEERMQYALLTAVIQMVVFLAVIMIVGIITSLV